MQFHSRDIKSYSDLLINVSPPRKKMAFWHKICFFLNAGIFWMNIFQTAFRNFRQESGFLTLLIVEKRHSFHFTSKIGRAYFSFLKMGEMHLWLLKNKERQSAAPFEKRKIWTLLNFVKRLFSSFWILWRVRFPHLEFCEESIYLMLNFVKCLKMDSISP